jgi:glutaconate CoA-transferase, subunit B
MKKYNSMELMIVVASRILEDGAVVFVGTGVPLFSAMLAQKISSPHLVIMFEAGGADPKMNKLPISVGDSRSTHKGIKATTMSEMMEFCQQGIVDYCFLGGAQIDKYGNLNSTVIGDFNKPKIRFPGSGGANDLASLCWKTLVVTPQNCKRFVEKPDFITTPGYLTGGNSRNESGLPLNTGPYRVITDIGVYGYHPETKEMMLLSLNAGHTIEDVKSNTGFDMLISDDLGKTLEPTDEELRVLREEVDPDKIVIGR